MSDNIFRILAILIFLVGAGISSHFRRKADRETGEKVHLRAYPNNPAALKAIRAQAK